MRWRLRPWRLIAGVVVVFAMLVALAGARAAAPTAEGAQETDLPADAETATAGAGALPPALTAAQARDLVARMSDQEARELLLKQLETPEPTVEPQPSAPTNLFFDVQASMYILRARLRQMIAAVPDLPSIWPFMVMRITKGYDPSHIWAIGGYILVTFAGALIGEVVLRRMFKPLLRQLSRLKVNSEFGKLSFLLLRALIDVLAVAAFAASAAILFLFLYKGHEAARVAFWSIFACLIVIRIGAVALEVLLSVRHPELRLPGIDDAAARRLYVSFLSLIALATGSTIFDNFAKQIGVAADQMLAIGELLFLINVAAQIAVLLVRRSDLTRLFAAASSDTAGEEGGFEALLSRHWHIFAVTFLVLLGIFATLHRLVTGESQGAHGLQTLAVLIALPLLDGLLRMIARHFFTGIEPAKADRWVEAASAEPADPDARTDRAADYGGVVLRNGRILLILLGVLTLAAIWDIRLEAVATQGVGARVAGSLFDIVITLILASATWGIVKTAINRQLPHEGLDALAMADGDIGGTGLSRLETLLPLLRKFLYITLIVIVTMIVISSLGINIGPLLAGAGVVGIAVGFGAQTLVRDIISGIFFLVDDAFRVGEYIDVGEGKGTVERMSVRSLMLRHHLGQIYTIPFGVIRRVTNYSRDWVIMKLEMRVPFETDLEQLRKLVKRVGVEMMADPTYGANFIQPLKSQGVHHMDDSSFVIRVKFMAKPGEQFVLRREVFRRLQEAFQANGIKFAPRRVIVEGHAASTLAAAALADDEIGAAPAKA